MRRLHTKPRQTENKTYLYSDDMLSEAIDELVKSVKIDRKYDIPYVAGYNNAGNVVYIDKDIPHFYRYKGERYAVDKYLVVHEIVEKVFEDTLKLNYFYAHQIALQVERKAVEADGLDWDAYDQYMQQWIKEVAHEKIQKVPADLDLQPYKDGKDWKLIDHMRDKMKTEVKEMAFIKELNSL